MQEITHPLGIKAFVFDNENDSPDQIEEPLCFLLGKDGWYVKRTNQFYTSVTKVKEADAFGEIKETVSYMTPKIPENLFMMVQSFFKAVYDEHKSEACVLLYHNLESAQWVFSVPDQKVSSGGVDYDEGRGVKIVNEAGEILDEVPEGFTKLGSIHSHASMGAFHSGTDDGDEFNFDGLHITIGSFSSTSPSYSCRWIISGKEAKIEIGDVVEMRGATFPEEITKLVKKNTTTVGTRVVGGTGIHYTGGSYGNQGGWQGGRGSHQSWQGGINGGAGASSGAKGNGQGKKNVTEPEAKQVGIQLSQNSGK